jgi:hypothetical protein
MLYNAKVAVYSEIHKKHKRNVSTMWNFWMSNLVVRKVTARLHKAKWPIEKRK